MKRLAPSIFFVLLPLLRLAAAGSELTVTGIAENYEHPSVGAGSRVQNLTFSSRGLSLLLASGIAAPVLVGGEVAGIFFEGDGSFFYDSSDPLETVAGRFTIDEATRLETETGGDRISVGGPLQRLLLWSTSDLLPPLLPADGPPPRDRFEVHRKAFADDWFDPPSILFAVPAIEAPEAAVVRAEMISGKDQLGYLFDPVYRRSETLYSLHKNLSRARALSSIVLAGQPIGRDRRDFETPALVLTDLTFTLTAVPSSICWNI